MSNVLVIAPHPDDETLGCGGALFYHLNKGDALHWIIITGIDEAQGYTREKVLARKNEIIKISEFYGFSSVLEYGYPTCSLDVVSRSELVSRLSDDFGLLKPEILYVPHYGDVHSDHKIVYEAAIAAAKWFRQPSIKAVRVYETLSETGLIGGEVFSPNQYIDISQFLEKKIAAMHIYGSEMGEHPFPRSETAMRSLAQYRGANSGFEYAEAFHLLYERI